VATNGGGSLLATNLAIACAESGSTTLLLTTDLRDDLGVRPRAAAAAAPAGPDSVPQADRPELLQTHLPNLYVGDASGLPTPARPGAISATLSAVSAAVDTVILDVESLGRVEAGLVVLVAEAGRTPEHDLRGAKDASERDARVIGLVLLDANTVTRIAS
jgi:hypothetical protein